MSNQVDGHRIFVVRATVHPIDARTVPELRIEQTVIDSHIWHELKTGRDCVLLSNVQARALRACLTETLGTLHSNHGSRLEIANEWWEELLRGEL